MSADFRLDAFLIGNVAFAAGGALLSWLACIALHVVWPGLSRPTFLAIVVASVPMLVILVIGLGRLAIEGFLSLSFVLAMRWEGWVFMLAAASAGLLVARVLAPERAPKVDSSIFE